MLLTIYEFLSVTCYLYLLIWNLLLLAKSCSFRSLLYVSEFFYFLPTHTQFFTSGQTILNKSEPNLLTSTILTPGHRTYLINYCCVLWPVLYIYPCYRVLVLYWWYLLFLQGSANDEKLAPKIYFHVGHLYCQALLQIQLKLRSSLSF